MLIYLIFFKKKKLVKKKLFSGQEKFCNVVDEREITGFSEDQIILMFVLHVRDKYQIFIIYW